MEQKSEILAKDIFNIHDKINVEKLEEVYLNYKKGIFYVSDRYEPVKITEGNIWDTEYHDRTWLFWHHCLICVEYLIDSFYIDRNVKKIQLAFELVEDWYNVNYPKSPVVMGWHDHSTALRLINIVKLYTIFKEYEEVEECTLLAQIAEKHIIKLKDTDFYMPKHNHGLDQDIAILYSAQVMSELENRESLVKLALERLFEQINSLFSNDGSYLEHSPQYIYLILTRLLNVYKNLLKMNHNKSTVLFEKIKKIATFFIYTLQPDGTFPTIGDSEMLKPIIENTDWKLLPETLYNTIFSLINKSENSIDLPLDSIYPEGDYAFFRSDWSNNVDTKQIVFYSAFHSRVHKHHDDLSFTLYAHGMPLLIDAGKYSYEYNKDERKYVTSAFGHNTVRINDTETDIKRLNIGKSGILSSLITRNICYVSGFQALCEGVVHRRILLYLKPNEIIVLDLIKGGNETKAEFILNFNPNVKLEEAKFGYIGLYNQKQIISLKDLLNENNFDLYKGERNPLRGWSSFVYKEFKPNYQIAKRKKGNDIKFATYINTSEKESVNEFQWLENQIKFKFRNFKVNIILSDLYEHIIINEKHYKTKKIFNKEKLFEGIMNNSIEYFNSKWEE